MNKLAQSIGGVDNTHDYIDNIINDIGLNRKVALSQIINSVSSEACWDDYISELGQWADVRKEAGDA